VNTLPGLTPVSLLPKIAQHAGLGFGALLERILALATRDETEVGAPLPPSLEVPLRRAAP
jgi:D-alanine-D-alanine ligase